ncbi:hypothetical protein NEF87_005084 [Candidatus Lokiarchaeum ossiferum]|uniref:Right handed beta helix domain-containing protein n=1 Tax=Candidatus Lokiarchaeum ossiferum TaxID=2951803 RepID=A0ABY6I1W6_9ARCH|nr:hypothetical protein NEF87_005084 [Candidatus Lokiarchaeum sp. B-35]
MLKTPKRNWISFAFLLIIVGSTISVGGVSFDSTSQRNKVISTIIASSDEFMFDPLIEFTDEGIISALDLKNHLFGNGTEQDPYILKDLSLNIQDYRPEYELYIRFSYSNKHVRIENCSFKYSYSSYSWPGDPSGGIYIHGSKNVHINNCTFLKMSVFPTAIYNSSHIIISNSSYYLNDNIAITVLGGDFISVLNSTFKSTAGGIKMKDVNNSYIDGNSLILNQNPGIIFTGNSKNISISHNHIKQNTLGIVISGSEERWYSNGVLTSETIKFVENVSIFQNIVEYSTLQGISIWKTINCSIWGNLLNNNIENGILLDEVDKVLVQENNISHNLKYGVNIVNSTNINLIDNYFTQNGISNIFGKYEDSLKTSSFKWGYWLFASLGVIAVPILIIVVKKYQNQKKTI